MEEEKPQVKCYLEVGLFKYNNNGKIIINQRIDFRFPKEIYDKFFISITVEQSTEKKFVISYPLQIKNTDINKYFLEQKVKQLKSERFEDRTLHKTRYYLYLNENGNDIYVLMMIMKMFQIIKKMRSSHSDNKILTELYDLPEILINIDGNLKFEPPKENVINTGHTRSEFESKEEKIRKIKKDPLNGGITWSDVKKDLLYIINTYIRVENGIPTLSNKNKTSEEIYNIIIDYISETKVKESQNARTILIPLISIALDALADLFYEKRFTLENFNTFINNDNNIINDKFKICINQENLKIANNRNKLFLTIDKTITNKTYCINLDDSDFVGFNNIKNDYGQSYAMLFDKTFKNKNKLNNGTIRSNKQGFGGTDVSFWTKIIPISELKNYQNYTADICEDGITYANYQNNQTDNIMKYAKGVTNSYIEYSGLSPHFNPPYVILLEYKNDDGEKYQLLTILDLLLTWQKNSVILVDEIIKYMTNNIHDNDNRALFLPSYDCEDISTNENNLKLKIDDSYWTSRNEKMDEEKDIIEKQIENSTEEMNKNEKQKIVIIKSQLYIFSRFNFITNFNDQYQKLDIDKLNPDITGAPQKFETSHIIGRLKVFYSNISDVEFVLPSFTGFNEKKKENKYSEYVLWRDAITNSLDDKAWEKYIFFIFILQFAIDFRVRYDKKNKTYSSLLDDMIKKNRITEEIMNEIYTFYQQFDYKNELIYIKNIATGNLDFFKNNKDLYETLCPNTLVGNLNSNQILSINLDYYKKCQQRMLNIILFMKYLDDNPDLKSDKSLLYYDYSLWILYEFIENKSVYKNVTDFENFINKVLNAYITYPMKSLKKDVMNNIPELKKVKNEETENFNIHTLDLNKEDITIENIFNEIDNRYKKISKLDPPKNIFEYKDVDVYYIGCSGIIIKKIVNDLLIRNVWNGWNTKIPFYGSDNNIKNILIKIKDFIFNNLLLIFVIILIILFVIYIIKKKLPVINKS